MRVLVCGGRDYSDHDHVYAVLDKVHAKQPITCIIQGGASGADRLAYLWACERGVPQLEFQAEWGMYGRAAGPRRNRQMITDGKPDMVIAFLGGTGTTSMWAIANAAGIATYRSTFFIAAKQTA